MTHKWSAGVLLLSLPNTKNGPAGPLLDSIDIYVEVPRVDYEKRSGARMGETSESFRKCVKVAHTIQLERFAE